MINVLLSGGLGTRLWPLSRTMLPKQFVRLFDGRSLFQNTLLRNSKLCSKFMIVSNVEQYFLALEQLGEVINQPAQFLLEPIGRNTAPAIALACMALDEDELVLVTPSDHLIKDQKAYERAITQAKNKAEQGFLVTFGIKPEYPETGFGYIESSGNDVLSFKEKPDAETARAYIEQGNYYWNSGMFCFKAGVFLDELKKLSPEIYQKCQDSMPSDKAGSEVRISLDAMKAIPEDSIDYAVMEKSTKVKVIPCEMGWSDLGSFDSLYKELKEAGEDNAVLPASANSPDPICVDSTDNLIIVHDRKITLLDIHDLLVVDTSDAILITKKDSSQKIKNVVMKVKEQQPELVEVHRTVYRPWGTYEVLKEADKYKVKRIVVKPGNKLSMQKHFHRNEHWIVVSGTATVTIDNETFLVRPNESTYIKMGQVHRLENAGKIDLVLIEVQVGEYTGEDDIIRIEDAYNRVVN